MGIYEIGDKVKGNKNAPKLLRNKEGVIRRKIAVKTDFIAYDVEFKNKINGHNTDCKEGSGNCHWMRENQIKLITTSKTTQKVQRKRTLVPAGITI
jgi:hypothetical protein